MDTNQIKDRVFDFLYEYRNMIKELIARSGYEVALEITHEEIKDLIATEFGVDIDLPEPPSDIISSFSDLIDYYEEFFEGS